MTIRKRYKSRQNNKNEGDFALAAEEVFSGGELTKENQDITTFLKNRSTLKSDSTPKSVDLRNYTKLEKGKLFNLTSVAMNSLVELGIAEKITDNLFKATTSPDNL